MEGLLYEMHLHTREGSACAISSAVEYPRLYKEVGFTGIVVTDHFFNGNTAVDRSLPWKAKVHEFCKGYEMAKNEGEKIGLEVLFGFEFNFHFDEYLVYGLGKEWLLENPEIMQMDRQTFANHVRKGGGCIVQAHPYRERDYIDKVRLHVEVVDAVEVYNSGNHISENVAAYKLAVEYNRPMLCGSDIHLASKESVENCLGTVFEKRLTNSKELADVIRSGKYMRLPEKAMIEMKNFHA